MSGTTSTALRPSESETERGDRGPEKPWAKPKVDKDDDRENDRTQEAEPDPNPDPIGKDPGERQP
jgi:hypothetical protein